MFSPIDWSQPWYHSVRDAALTILAQPNWRHALNAQAAHMALRNHRDLPLHFVAQADLPEGVAYEAFISASGGVPTRNNLHDFFGALVWLSFPLIKQQLNALQAAQIALAGVGKSRGSARDCATIFDENSALLVMRNTEQGQALVDALRNHRWHSAFIEQRDVFMHDAELWLFGHALMEKLVHPYKAITTHTRVVFADDDFFVLPHAMRRAWIDRTVAHELSTEVLDTRCFMPLQVLGVPGWWPDQNIEFYADATVFRPQRPAVACDPEAP